MLNGLMSQEYRSPMTLPYCAVLSIRTFLCLSVYPPVLTLKRCFDPRHVSVSWCAILSPIIYRSPSQSITQPDRWTIRPRDHSYYYSSLLPFIPSSPPSYSLSMESPSLSLSPSLLEWIYQLDWHHSWSQGASI